MYTLSPTDSLLWYPQPEVAVSVCERTKVLTFLLKRIKAKKFDANKLYCSEILSILLQADSRNQRAFGALPVPLPLVQSLARN